MTLHNVLLDSVTLVNYVKQVTPGASESKTIVQGGSYGGFLSYLLRVQYPDTFCGSLASSAPSKGIISDPKWPLATAWGDWARPQFNEPLS